MKNYGDAMVSKELGKVTWSLHTHLAKTMICDECERVGVNVTHEPLHGYAIANNWYCSACEPPVPEGWERVVLPTNMDAADSKI